MARMGSELTRKERAAIKARHAPIGKPVITNKEFERMKITESGISGTIITLTTDLATLNREIAADQKGVRDFDIQIERLKLQVEAIEKQKKGMISWAAEYDRVIGPMQTTYGANVDGIATIYNNAKVFHGKGIKLLEEEFNYHPAFKKHGAEFHAIPFRPK